MTWSRPLKRSLACQPLPWPLRPLVVLLQAVVLFLWWPKSGVAQMLESQHGPHTLAAVVMAVGVTMAYFALRPELYFDAVADVQPTAQSMPGTSVQFTIVNDLAIAPSALTENYDVNTVALSDSTVNLTLAEYGNAVLTTAKLRRQADPRVRLRPESRRNATHENHGAIKTVRANAGT